MFQSATPVRNSIAKTVAMLFACLLTSTSHAQVAAEFHGGVNDPYFPIGDDAVQYGFRNRVYGQTFLSHGTGMLTTLAVGLSAFPSNPLDITMTIWTTNAQNVSTQRGSVTLTSAAVFANGGTGTGRATVFDFTSLNLDIADGTTYAWTVTVDHGTIDDGSPSSHHPYGLFGLSRQGGYDDGSALSSDYGIGGPWNNQLISRYSINFQANYTVPTAPSFAVLALAGLAGLRRRR